MSHSHRDDQSLEELGAARAEEIDRGREPPRVDNAAQAAIAAAKRAKDDEPPPEHLEQRTYTQGGGVEDARRTAAVDETDEHAGELGRASHGGDGPPAPIATEVDDGTRWIRGGWMDILGIPESVRSWATAPTSPDETIRDQGGGWASHHEPSRE